MNVYTAARSTLRLGAPLARGGEATVYPVGGRDAVLAKLYTHARPEMQEKLSGMCASPPDDPTRGLGHASIAWPQELLFDGDRRFVGYLMPYIHGAVPIVEVYNPRRRATVLPGFNLAYLHRTARNLASAVAALHARGYVVGDLNERNVLVTPRALVTLIDTDSFQVEHAVPGKIITYPCPVGRLEYTPPELQGQGFRGVRRLPEHDAFGLGVLIFQLLMEGNHPFRGRWLAESEPPAIEGKIAEGLFPWAPVAAGIAGPPPGAPDPAALHPDVAGAFWRCFVDGHTAPRWRPTAEEWADALAAAEDGLVVCGDGHCFAGHLKRCPICNGRRAGRALPATETRSPKSATSRANGSTPARARDAAVGRGVTAPAFGGAATGLVARARAVLGGSGTSSGPQLRSARAGAARRPGPPRPTAARARAGLPATPQSIGWAAGLALAGAVLAVVAGAASTALLRALAAPAAAGATPAAIAWAAVVGALSLGVVNLFREFEPSRDVRPRRLLAHAGLTRAAWGLGGWTAGWWLAGVVFTTLGLAVPEPSTFARTFGAGAEGALGAAVGWTIAWGLYGATGAALGGLLGDRRAGWAGVAAVFGAAGWLAARVAAAVWVA